ncbi:hypothetical protein M426DRAFT_319001 [Hypoxylon sp. CI-4A]|nr:hypothetical protein M426DRAFT_319001 [Hypoxylon sp. CI-4A]
MYILIFFPVLALLLYDRYRAVHSRTLELGFLSASHRTRILAVLSIFNIPEITSPVCRFPDTDLHSAFLVYIRSSI